MGNGDELEGCYPEDAVNFLPISLEVHLAIGAKTDEVEFVEVGKVTLFIPLWVDHLAVLGFHSYEIEGNEFPVGAYRPFEEPY